MFVAPFYWGCGGLGDLVVVGSGVRVRSRPNAKAPVLAVVNFAVLSRDDAASVRGWKAVQLPNGKPGFVAERFTRSAVGYRAYFTKVNGAWRLTAFIAGD